jgi:hypothetical protein
MINKCSDKCVKQIQEITNSFLTGIFKSRLIDITKNIVN